MNEFKFTADFISSPYGHTENISKVLPAPVFIKEFQLETAPKQAYLYISTLGNGYVEINGKPLRARLLTSQSNYLKTIFYDKLDVTEFLKSGDNVIFIELGNGFYNDFVVNGWNTHKALWRDSLKLIAEFDIHYPDGREFRLKSDSTFTVIEGEVVFDSIRNGEYHDASRKITIDNYSTLIKSGKPAVPCYNITGQLVMSQVPPIAEKDRLRPVKIIKNKKGGYLFDFGRNIAGYVSFFAEGDKGEEITVRYAEKQSEGFADQSNIDVYCKEGLFQTDKLILSGNRDNFCPRHTYAGFRYAEITGLNNAPETYGVEAVVIYQDVDRTTAFNCGNELFNKIFDCAIYSSMSNMHNVITDCPTREKLGWTGDLHMSTEQLLLDFDIVGMMKNIMHQLADSQNHLGQLPGIVPTSGWGYTWGNGPTFDGSLFEIAFKVYESCGDDSLFKKYFETLDKYLDYLYGRRDGKGMLGIGLGDWAVPREDIGDYQTPITATDTMYFMQFLSMMIKGCKLSGKSADKYTKMLDEVKKSFDAEFVNAEGATVQTQTFLAFVISLNLHSEPDRRNFARQLVNRCEELNYLHECGIIGMRYLFRSLTDIGRFDIAFRILNGRKQPSYGYWIDNGNTTLTESWQDIYSKNHHMASDVAAFFIKFIAGVNYDFDKGLTISPNGFGLLPSAAAKVKLHCAAVSASWEKCGETILLKVENGGLVYRLNLPAGYGIESQSCEENCDSYLIRKINEFSGS